MSSLVQTRRSGFWGLAALQFLISFADWMLLVLLQIIIFDLTHSAFNIMLLVVCELIPMLVLGAWAGAITDRANLRKTLVWALVMRLLITMALLFAALRQELIALFLVAALGAACNRFFVPAASALLPSLVTAARLPAANSIVMAARMSGMAVGTLMAGVVTSHYGQDIAVLLIGALLLLAACLCFLLPRTPSLKPEDATKQNLWVDLCLALSRYGSSLVLPMSASILVMLALGSFEVLALLYIVQVLARPSADVGILFAAYGTGMLAGLAMASWKRLMPRYPLWIGISLFLMCLAIWGLSRIFVLEQALPLVMLAGLAEGLVITLSLLRIYQQVAGEFYARVIGLLDTGTGAAFLVSVMLTGMIADRYPAGVLLSGLAWILIGLFVLGLVLLPYWLKADVSLGSEAREADEPTL
ncbi:MFS transporter [Alcaligenes sp. SDU_A2]|uniref:MFS transporter n=1 Tax=Alcaligenes sp. SDU_A2 TaxID=3136634 RepID=UPI00311EB72B